MNILCRLGIHRYRTVATGNRYTPLRLILACTRCGLIHGSQEVAEQTTGHFDLSGWWYMRPGESFEQHAARLNTDPRWPT